MEILTVVLQLAFWFLFTFGFLYLYFLLTPLTKEQLLEVEERSKKIIEERVNEQSEYSTFPKPQNLGETHGNQNLYPKNPYLGQIIINKEHSITITRLWDGANWCIIKGENK